MNISSVSSLNLYQNYSQLSSGMRINSAADDAAGLAIAKKLEAQSNGYDVGKRNAADSQNMINVADGALSSISNSLQRMRELSIQASNSAVYGDSERNAMQMEIDQLKEHISDVAKNTQFNKTNLLDGSMTDSHVASDADGGGMNINMPNSTLEALGIADYNIAGSFDISALDNAITKVTKMRGELGASSNRLDSTIAYNSYASYNLTASRSRIEDLDMPKAISDMKKNQLLEQYKLAMLKKKIEDDEDGSFRLIRK